MKLFNLFVLLALALCGNGALAFTTPSNKAVTVTTKPVEVVTSIPQKIDAMILPTAAAITTAVLTSPVYPAFAKAKDTMAPPDYIGKDMAASYLPAIMVPLVGLIFPAFSMALFFLYSQQDDIE